MKCPSCGAEIPSGSFMCPECGEEIRIVPDFDTDVELDIEAAVKSIAETIEGSNTDSHEGSEDTKVIITEIDGTGDGVVKQGFSFRKLIWIPVVLVLFLAIGGVLYYNKYLEEINSYDFQLKLARDFTTSGEYDKAVVSYLRAFELQEADVDLKFELANAYFMINDEVDYEDIIMSIITDPNSTTEQLDSAYGKLIAIYKTKGDYDKIFSILKDSANEDIKDKYSSYMVTEPEFSLEAGTYETIQPVKITNEGSGRIFYTLDGSIPDEKSILYNGTILLESGETTLKAIFISDTGVKSNVVTAKYSILAEGLEAPVVMTAGGLYTSPTMIEVEEDPVGQIYYTTNGSKPTVKSNHYEGPLIMPLGESTYRFITIYEDMTSDIVTVKYNFQLNSEIDVVTAVQDVVEYCLDSGRISDLSGHFDDTQAHLDFMFQYVVDMDGFNYYYVVQECLNDGNGNRTKTGTNYAVHCNNGSIYKIEIEGANSYRLINID